MDPKNRLFRPKALERLSSPERLDKAVRIIRPQDWAPLAVLGSMTTLGMIWSLAGRLPMNVTGQGILINPHRIVQVQSPVSGQLQTLTVNAGECVERNQVLATIDPSDLKQQRQQQQETLIQLQQQADEDGQVRAQRTALEQAEIAAQQTSLQQQLQHAQSLTPILQAEGLKVISQQRISLQQQLQDVQELAPIYDNRVQNRQRLVEAGALSQDALFEVELQSRQAHQDIAKLEAELEQLNLQEIEAQQRYEENLDAISQRQAQLEELQTRRKRLEQDNLEARQTRNREIQTVQHSLAQLDRQITDNSQIKSPHAGCIVEITVSEGQVVAPSAHIGTIQLAGTDDPIVETSVLYFSVQDGKQIQPGMKVLVSPSPVKRERFGSIVGNVLSVSSFPITREGAASVVGNPDLADQLIGQSGGKIEVITQLNPDPDTFSGYQWSSSKGPDLELTLGTTVTAHITVEERAPITFLLPILREWSGLQE